MSIPNTPSAETARPVSSTPRAGTIVWGVICLVIATLVLLHMVLEIDFEPAAVTVLVLLGSGVVLLATGMFKIIRKR